MLIERAVVKAQTYPSNEKGMVLRQAISMIAEQNSAFRLGFKAAGLQNP